MVWWRGEEGVRRGREKQEEVPSLFRAVEEIRKISDTLLSSYLSSFRQAQSDAVDDDDLKLFGGDGEFLKFFEREKPSTGDEDSGEDDSDEDSPDRGLNLSRNVERYLESSFSQYFEEGDHGTTEQWNSADHTSRISSQKSSRSRSSFHNEDSSAALECPRSEQVLEDVHPGPPEPEDQAPSSDRGFGWSQGDGGSPLLQKETKYTVNHRTPACRVPL